jgi:hypothetical protein
MKGIYGDCRTKDENMANTNGGLDTGLIRRFGLTIGHQLAENMIVKKAKIMLPDSIQSNNARLG